MPLLSESQPQAMPLLPLRGLVVFPGMMIHFDVGRSKSVAAINRAMEKDQTIFLVAQRSLLESEPDAEDLYEVGTVARIRQILRLPEQNVRILVEGLYRARRAAMLKTEPYFSAVVERCIEKVPRVRTLYRETLVRRMRAAFEEYAEVAPQVAPDIALTVASSDDLGYLADFIVANIPVPPDDKQYILEELGPVARAKAVLQLLDRECQILQLDAQIGEKVRTQMDDNQREYYLREQLRAIQGELYGDDGQDELREYDEKIAALNAPNEIRDKLREELSKLAKMPQGSHEGTVVRTYLDTCLALPWNVHHTSPVRLSRSQQILDRDFYGMKQVKERILEQLSVSVLAPDVTGQILCLVGPPGVGKTSIARSIAACMGRKFARVSLGGVHDEAEIRGHRRTYIGAMPGKIMQAIQQAGSCDPVLLLDEIDKLGNDYHGDPAAAMLEVLDGEQNVAFRDHFIDLPFDLSHVVFLTTANTLDTIPAPLLDRLEVIELSSYTREEKFQIAKRHLLKKQRARHGLSAATCKISDAALYALVDFYTREAGVRKLERAIATLCRKAAKEIVAGEKKRVVIDEGDLERLLGPKKYRPEWILPQDEVGVINGLAWTSVGGELMQLEVAAVEGTGKLELTGSLGDVMQESARAAVTYVRSRARDYGISPTFYKELDIHIHATEAAVPKDGPSAGVTIATALISALTGRPVRRDVAMTGEITVRGRVLPIGGLKEKTMAAYRAGVTTVFLPKENEPDLAEIDETVRQSLRFCCVSTVDEILPQALLPAPTVQPALSPLCEPSLTAAAPTAIKQ